MRCPMCRSHAPASTILPSPEPATRIVECRQCGTIWSVLHGSIEIVRDAQERSFLEAVTECVEGDDYYLVA